MVPRWTDASDGYPRNNVPACGDDPRVLSSGEVAMHGTIIDDVPLLYHLGKRCVIGAW